MLRVQGSNKLGQHLSSAMPFMKAWSKIAGKLKVAYLRLMRPDVKYATLGIEVSRSGYH